MKKNPFTHGYYTSDELKKFNFKSIGKNVKIAKNCIIVGIENVSIGNNVQIDGGVYIIAESGFINIGNYVHISKGCYFSCCGGIILEDFSGLACNVSLYSGTDDYKGKSMTNPTIPPHLRGAMRKGLIKICKHSIIGAGTVLLPNCTVSEGSSIGALSLVPENSILKEWKIYFGSPVRPIGHRDKKILELEKEIN